MTLAGAEKTTHRRRRAPRWIERLEPRTLCDATPAAWFRADTITAPSGSTISTWPDSSGQLRHASQSDPARRPRFVADGLNGRPAVRFDAASSTQLAFSRPAAGDFTIVVVFGSDRGAGHGDDWYTGAGLVDGEVAGVTNDYGVSFNGFGQVLAGTGAPDTSLTSGMGFNDGRAHVATFTRTAATGAVSLHVDGRLFGTAAGGRQSLTAAPRLTIGSLQTNTNYFTGDVGEIRVYSSALSGAERSAVEAGLRTAYNVAPPPAGWFQNPVINSDFPDPGVVRTAGGAYYAFATNGNGRNVQAARSTDLASWATLYDALPTLPAWAQAGRTWAPDVAVTAGGRYNLYYTAWSRATGRQAIGVATSSDPGGPFTPAGMLPLVTQTAEGGAIDPSVFTASNGAQYLLWKNDGNAVNRDTFIYMRPLSADGLSFTGTETQLIRQDQEWEGNLVEGPVLWAHGGKYYLFYSANNYASGAYATGYAVSSSLLGPYVKPASGPLVSTEGAVIGPGGPEIVTGPDGNDWMLYHSWENSLSFRSMSADMLEWDGDEPALRGPSRAAQPVPQRPTVVGRHTFYNNSAFDGRSAAANSRDDSAIATDKRPLFPGGAATFANVTNSTRGINGIMFDVSALPRDAATPAASSFDVRVGTGGDPAGWARGPAPSAVTVRRGQGVNGSDRVTLVWPDGAIRNAWVRVTVPAAASTALAAPDVFSFGNLVGETGEGASALRVDVLDVLAVRRGLFSTAPVTDRLDVNRDGRVTVADLLAVRSNVGRSLT